MSTPPNDPFAAFDSGRTLVKPNPNRPDPNRPDPSRFDPNRPAAPAAAPPSPGMGGGKPGAMAPVPEQLFSLGGSLNPLLAAATPLLGTAVQLRSMARCEDPVGLRDAIARMVRQFEQHARAAKLTEPQLVASRYMLCTFLDESAANTPWGSGIWSKQSLLALFHNETWGGEKVFRLASKLAESPSEHLSLLELFYTILSLGFEGRFRVMDNGASQLAQVRERLYRIIAQQRSAPEAELSPHWQGVATTRQNFTDFLPTWVVGAAALLLLAVVYFVLSQWLGSHTMPVFDRITQVRVPNPPPPPPAKVKRLAQFLPNEIAQGYVDVNDLDDKSIVRLRSDGVFASGSADIDPKVHFVLERIGFALNQVKGTIRIEGHSDDQPIRGSLRFPNNQVLSESRALTVMGLLSRPPSSVDPSRMEPPIGLASSMPLCNEATPACRSRNRRVEITLLVPPEAR